MGDLPLTDRLGRIHRYLRISVTDRCNYRCVYCMPAEGMSWLPREGLLTFEEIGRLVGIFSRMGVTKVRLTGGEPTVRSDITELIRGISVHSGITDLAMTTNGHNLPRLAAPLREAGLRRVNISIDTLDPGGFRTITRGGDLSRVLNGIEEAIRVGLTPIKLNAVIMAGQNEDQLWPLIRFAQARAPAVELRFIEYMPFEQRLHGSIASAELRRRVAEVGTLSPAENAGLASGPARTFVFDGGPLKVGFISPLSEHFCAACNRLRLQSDGHLRTCLAHEDTPSLRDILRNGATDEDIQRAIRAMVYAKPDGHEATLSGGVPFSGVMTAVGG